MDISDKIMYAYTIIGILLYLFIFEKYDKKYDELSFRAKEVLIWLEVIFLWSGMIIGFVRDIKTTYNECYRKNRVK